ncbi:hypothetical protein [Photobacterium leiognathi]|uniref:Uncharacterized protein n=1 Tax=Photobacterium leiognathi subsp. mandapamensis TaxID=48408 RepID=A0A2T3KZ24_PHOLD|nr:hypothetical protein [Photobacterium leiognathi]PSV13375.1 hypothetical protein C0W93_00045 [Photobacterium leiognathi subsp. mandapamensis]
MEQYILDKMIESNSLLIDIVMILLQLIIEMKSAGQLFYISIPVAILVSICVVWLIKIIVKNVNKSYDLGVGFAISSFFSFITTFSAVLFLFSLQFTEPVVKAVIKGWEVSLMANSDWRDKTFREAYENVADLKTEDGRQIENFNGSPHPDTGGSTIPTHSEKAKLVATNTYLIAAENNFEKTVPLLNWILTAKSGTAESDILNDMKLHFSKNNSTYQVDNAYKIASDRISKALLEQSGRIIIVGSIFVFVTWLLIQIIVIGLISWIALRSIKENFGAFKAV